MHISNSRSRARSRWTTLLVALGALLVAAPAASAATLAMDGSRLVYTAGPGVDNQLAFDDPAAGTVTVSSSNDPVTSAPGNCTDTDDPDAGLNYSCTGVTALTVNAGDGNDEVDGGDLDTVPVVFNLGTGNDFAAGSRVADQLFGEDGVDVILGEADGGGPNAPGGDDLIDGGAGDDDFLGGGPGNDTVRAGIGNDTLTGGRGNDTVDAGAGDDYAWGGPEADTVNGGDGSDYLRGGCDGQCGNTNALDPANDVVNGDAGDDNLAGEGGDDIVNGGAGSDLFSTSADFDLDPTNITETSRDPGNDTWNGGTGIDTIEYYGYVYQHGPTHNIEENTAEGIAVRVTQDGAANDGQTGENDNVNVDIEDIVVYSYGENPGQGGAANIVGGPGINAIRTGGGADTVDPGAGNDFVYTQDGNDTINSRDGFADRIDCGETFGVEDADVANVDQFDQVSDNCEQVNVAGTANANEDVPPTIAWATPAQGARMSTTRTTVLTVTTSPDTTQVVFLDDDRVVCTDTTAPFTCDYRPRGDDVGRNTLVAVAYDANQQTATAVRTVVVPRFRPGIRASTSPKRDSSSPYTFTTSGRIVRPARVSAALGCRGQVTIQIRAGKKTISTRRAKVRKNCRFSRKVTFDVPARLNPDKLQVFVRFGGNAVFTARSRKKYTVNVG